MILPYLGSSELFQSSKRWACLPSLVLLRGQCPGDFTHEGQSIAIRILQEGHPKIMALHSGNQMRFLHGRHASIFQRGMPITLGNLAAVEQVRPPTMTRIVNALEEQGLVVKKKMQTTAVALVFQQRPPERNF
jgi:hypothetical protein